VAVAPRDLIRPTTSTRTRRRYARRLAAAAHTHGHLIGAPEKRLDLRPRPRCAGAHTARVERAVERIGPARSSCARRAQRTATATRRAWTGRLGRRERRPWVAAGAREARAISARSTTKLSVAPIRTKARLLKQTDTAHHRTASARIEPAVCSTRRVKISEELRAKNYAERCATYHGVLACGDFGHRSGSQSEDPVGCAGARSWPPIRENVRRPDLLMTGDQP
jgi:hypothetical protein